MPHWLLPSMCSPLEVTIVLHQVWPWCSPPYSHSAHPEYVTPWNLNGNTHCLPAAGPATVVH